MDKKYIMEKYKALKKDIDAQLKSFKEKKDKESIFLEFCFCLLTPQSKAKDAWESIMLLKSKNLLKSKKPEEISKYIKVRFKNKKAIYLTKNNFDRVYEVLKKEKDSKKIREYLVKNVKGYSYKEASHFLRNIGYFDLAIIDRHILKKMKEYNYIDEIPKNISKNKYLELEKTFFKMAKDLQISPEALDLLLWQEKTGFIFK